MNPAAPTNLPEPPPTPGPTWRRRLRRALITGLVILVPVALTAFILAKLFEWMDGIFAPVVQRFIGSYFPGYYVPGLGVVLTLLVVLVLGWLSTNVVGRRLIRLFDSVVARIPIASSVYAATKGILEAVSVEQTEAFKRVVLVEYPKKDLFALAFVTGNARWPGVDPRTADTLLVFLPTTPNPTSGFLLMVPRDEALELPITVEEGVRMVISGGILLPNTPALTDAGHGS